MGALPTTTAPMTARESPTTTGRAPTPARAAASTTTPAPGPRVPALRRTEPFSADLGEDVVGDVEVRIDRVHVLQIVQRLDQREHLAGLSPFHADRGLRLHGQLSGHDRDTLPLQRGANHREIRRSRGHLP